ncbi:hypothetical protein DJ568_16200 [Mucilaginibacter hurinus]|uniref:Ricin B lectin domain-containing protein n=1 Tax=Mucilaginibacter hurinus TaxID=2201324 RepID=A0A367GJX5_9SPHI|nr:RICIN domain-containing protein [Mucilaginibacter hurinus]RCH53777.1 hypothetical protein DJ568_16200 [Mucilaginibacter hurinus]
MKKQLLILLSACMLVIFEGCKRDANLQPAKQLDSKKATLWEGGDPLVNGRWKFTQYQNPNKSVCVVGNALSDGAGIHQWYYKPTNSQNWDLTKQTVGGIDYFKIVSVASGKALAAPGNSSGVQLVQKTVTADDKQLWRIIYVGGYGLYYITNKSSGLAITLQSTPGADGTTLIQAAYTAAGSQYFHFYNLTYPVLGARIHIYNPQPGGQQYYINDHCFIQHTNGIWHMFGITRKWDTDDIDGGKEISFAHATASTLDQIDWNPKADIQRHPSEVTPGGWNPIWAPHVVYDAATAKYYMFYSGGISSHQMQMRVRTSTDLYNWSAPVNLFIDGYLARDPRVMKIGSQWVMYYSATANGNATDFGLNIVAYRTSASLTSGWSGRKVAFSDYTNDYLTESPYVAKVGSYYYLFRCWGGFPWETKYEVTDVYRGTDPFNFTSFQKVGVIKAHAAEVLQGEGGQWWASHCGLGKNGLYLAPIDWEP